VVKKISSTVAVNTTRVGPTDTANAFLCGGVKLKKYLNALVTGKEIEAQELQNVENTQRETCVTIARILCYALRCGLTIKIII